MFAPAWDNIYIVDKCFESKSLAVWHNGVAAKKRGITPLHLKFVVVASARTIDPQIDTLEPFFEEHKKRY